jgi:diacylglycerol kinase family enzyme
MNVVADARVAVLLNANAKRVSRRVHRALRHVVPDDDLFLSRTVDEARAIARTVIERSYRTVFTGGGDGTFVSFVTEILEFLRNRPAPLPRFGVLKLGTGNALAGMVGATAGEGILDDVLRARAGEVPSLRKIHLIEADARFTPFAGIGLDAALLNDYVWTKRRFSRGALRRFGTGGAAYAFAAASRTLPRYLRGRRAAEIEVVNAGGPAALLDASGQPLRVFDPGEVLFRGPAMMASVSTVPYYGFNFRMFPYAGTVPGKMQLRVSNIGPVRALANLDRIWAGRYRHPEISDFLVDAVRITSERAMPYQVGGDADGFRESIEFRLAEKDVELVDFSRQVH